MYCLVYIPTGEVCEAFEGVCFHVFDTECDAVSWVKAQCSKVSVDYRVEPLANYPNLVAWTSK